MARVDNSTVASVFSQMADLMEIRADNLFRVRAFRRIAEAVAGLPEPAAKMLEAGTLARIPGIGEGAITRIEQIIERGSCDDLEALQRELPSGLLDLLRISGMGLKKVKLVYDELGIASVDELEAAARAGHLAALPHMGAKSEETLLRAIASYRRRSGTADTSGESH